MAQKKFYVEAEELESVYKQHGSMLKVADYYGVSKKLVLNYMNRYDIERNQRETKKTVQQIRELAEIMTSTDIAKHLGISLVQINKHIHKHNIPIARYHKGYVITASGYVLIKDIEHAHAAKNGYVREHIKVMVEHLGRPLKEHEVVHHKDGNKRNNDLSNLELMNAYDHKCYHSRKPRKSRKMALMI